MVLTPPEKLREYFHEDTFPGRKVKEDKLGVLMACLLLASDSSESHRVLGITHPERLEILKGLGFKRE